MDLRHHHLFTHAGCMDGSGAAILFKHAGGDLKNVHWTRAGGLGDALADAPIVQNPNAPLLIVDVAPENEEVAAYLHERGNFYVIDHHGSATKYCGRHGYHVSEKNDACGTEMFRKWLANNGMTTFHNPPFKRFASLIDDHDRWVMNQPMSIEMPRLFAFIGQNKFVEWFMDVEKRFIVEKDYYWYPEEQRLLELLSDGQATRFKYLIGNKFIQKMMPFKDNEIKIAYIISGEINCSELLHEYLNANPDTDVACQINLDLGKVSLRSNDRVDITELVKQWKGGGHKNAGGHGLPEDLNEMIIRSVHAM